MFKQTLEFQTRPSRNEPYERGKWHQTNDVHKSPWLFRKTLATGMKFKSCSFLHKSPWLCLAIYCQRCEIQLFVRSGGSAIIDNCKHVLNIIIVGSTNNSNNSNNTNNNNSDKMPEARNSIVCSKTWSRSSASRPAYFSYYYHCYYYYYYYYYHHYY